MNSNSTEIEYTCKEAHRLSSEALDRELSPLEQTLLREHLLACIACTTMHGQMDLIRRAMRQFPLGDGTDLKLRSK